MIMHHHSGKSLLYPSVRDFRLKSWIKALPEQARMMAWTRARTASFRATCCKYRCLHLFSIYWFTGNKAYLHSLCQNWCMRRKKKTSWFFSRNLLPLLARLSAILSSQMLNVCFTNVKGASSALQGIILKRELPVKYENPLQVQEIAFDFFFTNVLATKPTRSLSAGITCSLQLFSDMFLERFCYQINHTRGRFCL